MAERDAREERDDLHRRWWASGHADGAAGRVCRTPLRSDPLVADMYVDGFNVGRRGAGLERKPARLAPPPGKV